MRKVSASPFYLRNVFPILWFGGLLFLSMNVFGNPGLSNDVGYALIATGIVGSILSRVLALKLADEVYDEGDSLLMRRNDTEQRIYLNQIRKISIHNNTWITLKTTNEGALGKSIRFALIPKLFNFKKHPYFIELQGRVESAKNT